MIFSFFCATVSSMKRMKKYKPLLMQVGVLLLVLSIAFYFLEQRTRFFSIDFSKQYSKYRTIEVAGFEEGEGWQGNFTYDSVRTLQGKSSIILSSWYGNLNTIQANKNFIIPPGYTNGYISIFVTDKKNLSSLVSLTLNLKGNNQQKDFDFTQLLQVGWNRLAVPIPNWKMISQISLSMLSKSGEIAEVNVDRFWIENTTGYKSDVFSTQSQSLSLRTIGQRTYVFSSSAEIATYSVTTPSQIQKGSITFSLIPEHSQEIQVSVNGTSMKIAGKNMSECTINKNAGTPVMKKLTSTSGNNDLYIFLKATVQNGKIAYSISNNGVDYETCGSVSYTQIKPIQLSLKGSYLIDSYYAEY